MGAVKGKTAGRADNKTVSDLVKKALLEFMIYLRVDFLIYLFKFLIILYIGRLRK